MYTILACFFMAMACAMFMLSAEAPTPLLYALALVICVIAVFMSACLFLKAMGRFFDEPR